MVYNIRIPRICEIAARGKTLDGGKRNVGIMVEYFLYFFLWILNTFPLIGKYIILNKCISQCLLIFILAKIILGDVNRRLYGWKAEEEVKKALEKELGEAESGK